MGTTLQENVLMFERGIYNVISGRSSWFKYSKYELIEVNGREYFSPVSGTKIEKYRPFDFRDQLLFDFLDKVIKFAKPETPNMRTLPGAENKNQKRLFISNTLDFINKWGLFGLFFERINSLDYTEEVEPGKKTLYAAPYSVNVKFDQCCALPLSLDGISDKGNIRYDKYAEIFFPRGWSIPDSVPSPFYEGSFIAFADSYSEPVDSIWQNEVLNMISNHYHLENNIEKSKSPQSTQIHAPYVSYSNMLYNLYDEPTKSYTLSFGFTNLMSALSVMYSLHLSNNLTSEGNYIRRCLNCDSPFLTKDSRKQYCNYTCQRASQTARARAKKKHSKNI